MVPIWVSIILDKNHCVSGANPADLLVSLGCHHGVLQNPPFIRFYKFVCPWKPPLSSGISQLTVFPEMGFPTKTSSSGISQENVALKPVYFGDFPWNLPCETAPFSRWVVALEDGTVRDLPGIVHWAHQQQVDASGRGTAAPRIRVQFWSRFWCRRLLYRMVSSMHTGSVPSSSWTVMERAGLCRWMCEYGVYSMSTHDLSGWFWVWVKQIRVLQWKMQQH